MDKHKHGHGSSNSSHHKKHGGSHHQQQRQQHGGSSSSSKAPSNNKPFKSDENSKKPIKLSKSVGQLPLHKKSNFYVPGFKFQCALPNVDTSLLKHSQPKLLQFPFDQQVQQQLEQQYNEVVNSNNNSSSSATTAAAAVVPLNQLKRFTVHKPTLLEKNYVHQILTERNMGIPIDLVAPTPEKRGTLHAADREISEGFSKIGSGISASGSSGKGRDRQSVTWLRKTEYMSGIDHGRHRMLQASNQTKEASEQNEENEEEVTAEDQLRRIEQTFEDAAAPVLRHSTNPSLKVEAEYPIVPNFALWENSYVLGHFDGDPIPADRYPNGEGNVPYSQLSISERKKMRNSLPSMHKLYRGALVVLIKDKNKESSEHDKDIQTLKSRQQEEPVSLLMPHKSENNNNNNDNNDDDNNNDDAAANMDENNLPIDYDVVREYSSILVEEEQAKKRSHIPSHVVTGHGSRDFDHFMFMMDDEAANCSYVKIHKRTNFIKKAPTIVAASSSSVLDEDGNYVQQQQQQSTVDEKKRCVVKRRSMTKGEIDARKKRRMELNTAPTNSGSASNEQ